MQHASVIRGTRHTRARLLAPYQWRAVCSADAVLTRPQGRIFSELASAGLPVVDPTVSAVVERAVGLPVWTWIATDHEEFAEATNALKAVHAEFGEVSVTTISPAGPGDLFEELVDAMDLLCSGGCPWDSDQTNLTLVPYLLEECHEVVQAVHNDDFSNLTEELGDLLMQVVFHARVAEKSVGPMPIELVVGGILEKLRRRQPALRGEPYSPTAWRDAKAAEGHPAAGSRDMPSSLHPADQLDHFMHRSDRRRHATSGAGDRLRTSMREAVHTLTPIGPIIHEILAEQASASR